MLKSVVVVFLSSIFGRAVTLYCPNTQGMYLGVASFHMALHTDVPVMLLNIVVPEKLGNSIIGRNNMMFQI